MRKLVLGAALAAFSMGAAVAATASATDKAFIAKVSQGGIFEVQAGQLAEAQGGTQDIRDQGNAEAHDHMLVGDKLKALAAADGITFPATLNASFSGELAQLKALQGHAFDAAYLADMKTVHDKDGATFAMEAKDGGDPALRGFAAETHRIVERHLGELQALPAS